mmetsp:Transcript_36577/g.67586  ORF Transcript_36577/g.67586 Transcript_36577/m.67586 type:complete len:217 (+) Transcript_36577:231-881(+)
MADETLDRPGSSVSKSTDSVAFDLTSKFVKHVNLFDLGLTSLHALHHLVEPGGTLSAWSALTTALVLVEVRKTSDGFDHVNAVIHHSHSSSTQSRLNTLKIVEVHKNVLADTLWNHRDRGTTRDDTLEVVPATNHPTAVHLDEILERNTHFFFNSDRIVHVSGDSKKFGATVSFAAHAGEPISPATKNSRGNGDGLDVGDGGWAAVKADVSRERRL